MDGWIRLYRSVLKSEVFGDAKLLKVWIWCLARANYRQRWVTMPTGSGTTRVELKPGQFVYGRRVASKELSIPASTIRRMMERLESMSNITQKADRHFTVVTICNWETYQDDGLACGPAVDQPWTSRGPAVDTDKKERREEGKKEERARADVPHPLIELIDGWNALKPKVKGTRPGPKPPLSQAVTAGWARAQRNPEQQEAFADIPAVLKAVGEATFCHGKGWFTLPWLFGKNNKGEFNVLKLLEGGYRNDGTNRSTDTRGRKHAGRLLGPRDPAS